MIAFIPIFPFIGFLINGLWYAFGQAPSKRHKASSDVTGGIATFFIFLSFLVSLVSFIQLFSMEGDHRILQESVFRWMTVGSFKVDFAFCLDSLSSLFTLVITGVGTLIHIYSIGYMKHDSTPGRFFAYLNLFCFAMLILVMGSSLPLLFMGWEGVGLCSYLLIGYWYTDLEKAQAGKKAFIVNRIGDFGFLLGMFLVFGQFGTLEFDALQAAVHHQGATLEPGIVTAICLLLFVGCMGKSAQIPLYVWLPDAMAGPTPVSALIHAATMVTSGVYLIARLNVLYSFSPVALQVVACVGAFTAFFAAMIAVAQKDIKKILAYSTVSQLGYMFLGCGVGAYTAGVFHVITHAFFKALLFLGAGSVIHGMHEEQDIWKMGGLRSKMPQTFLTVGVGWLAICGVPPFSGFFSKDEILWQAFHSIHGSTFLWAMGAITAVLTAFYMTRLFSLTFLGAPRFDKTGEGHGDRSVHESPFVMVFPLQILAFFSLVAGFMGVPHWSWLEHWLEPVIPLHEGFSVGEGSSMEWVLMLISVLGAGMGIAVALKAYRDLEFIQRLGKRFRLLVKLLENKWYIDEIYEAIFVQPIRKISEILWKKIDILGVDWIVLRFGKISMKTGAAVRMIQTGSIQTYALALLIGLAVATGYLFYASF